MKAISYWFVLGLVCFTTRLPAQQVFEDAQGETTFYTNRNSQFGWFKINTSATNFSTGYNHFKPTGPGFKPTYGGNATVGIKNGVGSLLKNNQLSPGLNLGGLFGFTSYDDLPYNSFLSFYIRYSASYAEYNIINGYDAKMPVNSDLELDNKKIWGHSILLHANTRINVPVLDSLDKPFGDKTYHMIGVSLGYKRGDNFSTLKEVQASNTLASTANLSIATITIARIGPFNQSNRFVFNADYGVLPSILEQKTIGFNTYARTEFSRGSVLYNHGVGIFFSKVGQPSSIVGGIAWQFNDIGNIAKTDKSLSERSTAFFYVGYNIGK